MKPKPKKQTRSPKSSPLSASLHRWSIEVGIDDATLAKYLRQAGIKIVKGMVLSARDVILAIRGDLRTAQVEKTMSETKLNEIEIQEKEKTLVPKAELEAALWSDVLLPARVDFLAIGKKHGGEVLADIEAWMAKHFQEPKKK